jgi:peptide/nickel transport system permease protein
VERLQSGEKVALARLAFVCRFTEKLLAIIMWRYFTRRIFSGILVLLGVIVVIFSIFLLINVDPSQLALGQRADAASKEAVSAKLGLELPWHQRLVKYVGELSPLWIHRTDVATQTELNHTILFTVAPGRALVVKPPYLGRSFQTDRRVGTMIGEALAKTLVLGFVALFIAVIVGVLLGVIAAIFHGRWIDQLLVSISAIGVSVPSYFSAIVFSFVFGYLLKDFTHLNMTGSLYDLSGNLQLKNLLLPAIALGIRPVAVLTQLARTAMLDVLSADYIKTARAKGLTLVTTIRKHALRNAMNPVVTSVSGWFASMLAGAYFVEVIFNYKGLGYLTIQAVETYDFPVMMGAVLLGAIFFVGINILVDIIYGWLDPRVSYQ